MRALRISSCLLGIPLLCGPPVPAGAQEVGEEFQVHTYTTGWQFEPAVASDSGGAFVVVWESQSQDGSGLGIFGQRFDDAGARRGAEFRVNSFTTSQQEDPSVASDAGGNFVVVWSSYGQDGYDSGIFGRRYDSSGAPKGPEFRVNSDTFFEQTAPRVASAADGRFVVVWEDDDSRYGQGDADIKGQRYDSQGVPLGGEFRVNSYTRHDQRDPFVATDASGNFVVVWSGAGAGEAAGGIFGQRYDSAGNALGGEFRVNSYTTGRQFQPSVASDASGNFVVAWMSPGQDGSDSGVFGQRYDDEGVAQGAEFQVNSHTAGAQADPAISSDASGDVVVAWLSQFQDGTDSGIFGQRYDFSAAQSIAVVSPNTNVRWRIGTLRQIRWMHDLGPDATFRIELDRDDDGVYEELLAENVPSEGAARGSLAWTVTGPPSNTARVRVSWSDDPSVSDASDVTFRIRPS